MPAPNSGDMRQICRNSERCSQISKDVRRRLRKEHLTQVYADVVGPTATLDDQDLVTLGFAPDILCSFECLTNPNSFQYTPSVPGFRLVPESAQYSISNLRLQIPESAE